MPRLLGRKLATGYELREMSEADLDYFDEAVGRNYYVTSRKTHAMSLVIAKKRGQRRPVFGIVAAKASSRKTTLTVRAIEQVGTLTANEQLRMMLLVLTAAFRYAQLTSTPCVKVRRVPRAQTPLYEQLGFRIEKDGLFCNACLYTSFAQ